MGKSENESVDKLAPELFDEKKENKPIISPFKTWPDTKLTPRREILEFGDEIKAGVSTISGFWQEFKDYIEGAEIIDDSLSYVAGQALTDVMNSFVSDLILPIGAAILGRPNFTNFFLVLKKGRELQEGYRTVKQARKDGATVVTFGRFIQKATNFIFLGFSLILFVRAFRTLLFSRRQILKASKKAEKSQRERDCPFCRSKISILASRCPHCTSHMPSPSSPSSS